MRAPFAIMLSSVLVGGSDEPVHRHDAEDRTEQEVADANAAYAAIEDFGHPALRPSGWPADEA